MPAWKYSFFKVSMAVCVSALAIIPASKLLFDINNSKARGEFAVSIIDQQLSVFEESPSFKEIESRLSHLKRGRFPSADLLEMGRQSYYRAKGYEKRGDLEIAFGYYLRSSKLLIKFLKIEPGHIDVPEVLFLIGDSFMRFYGLVPTNVRLDRILNLCGELYPETIWARRARARWISLMEERDV